MKPEAAVTLRTLQKMGIETCMVTGDNRRTALAVAADIGVKKVFAETLPHEKVPKQ